MWRIAFTMMLLVLPAQGAEEDFIEVLTPAGQISVSSGDLHVIGHTSAPAVKLVLNDKAGRMVAVKDSVFHIHLKFGYGLSEVHLTPLNGDSLAPSGKTETLEIMYGPRVSRKFRKVFPKYVFHDAKPRRVCVRCHDDACEDLANVSNEAVCLVCHHDLEDRFEKHTSADDRTCVNCHALDRQLAAGQTSDASASSCYACHTDKIGEYDQEYIHGPVAGGACVMCHDPHGSPYDWNLYNPQQILCFSCHDTMEDELDREFVHYPFENGQCSSCHDPHATANKWVLIKTSEEICIGCHEELGTLETHRHPYNVAPRRPLRVDLKLTESGVLECLSCHDPHSSGAAHLLKLPGSFNCQACHDDK